MRSRAPLALAVLLSTTVARASPAEVFGFGSQSAGMAGAVAATVVDFSSSHYNPAGLSFGSGKRLTLGVLGAASNLHVNHDRTVALEDPFGLVIGASAPAPLGGALKDRVHVGVGLYLLPTKVLQVIARHPDEAFYPYYDNRSQRLVVLPAISARVRDDLSFGVALNLLAGLSGRVLGTEGPTRSVEARVDEEIFTTVALNAGARWRAARWIDAAFVFRQAFSVPFSTRTDNEVAGEPIDLDIHAEGLYTPTQFVVGAAIHPLATLDLTLDATVSLWSLFPGPYVRVDSELPLVGALSGEIPDVPYSDTIAVRAGVEHRVRAVSLRGGVGYETSPIPTSQPGVTNLLDGDKATFALGVGFRIARKVRIDAHAQAQLVLDRTMEKRVADPSEDPASFDALRDEVRDDPSEPSTQGVQISNPGYPRISSGGQVFSAGITVEIEL